MSGENGIRERIKASLAEHAWRGFRQRLRKTCWQSWATKASGR